MTPRLTSMLYVCALSVAIAVLYSFGIDNQLVFDDERLIDGTIFGQYGSLLQLKTRVLSYGSFVWLQNILGDGWWKQRIFNIALHIGTALTLYALTLELLQQVHWSQRVNEIGTPRDASKFSTSLRNAALAGTAFWAFNPVAVYAVAYLIQRSILMATLFVALSILSFVRGLVSPRFQWFALALLCYFLAVASKEHAVTAILLTLPIYVFIRRPTVKRLALVAGTSTVILLLTGGLLFNQYSSILGSVFDAISLAHATHLEQMQPGISPKLYPLSIVNQAFLFFYYGLLWFLPYVGWMSIDIRPAYPIAFMSWQTVGAVAWMGLLLGSARLVLRRTDIWSLAGLAVLLPTLMFITEFSTVWLQDPFVLYRSYLWSIGIPILLALPLAGRSSLQLYAVVAIAVGVLAASSIERIRSLSTLQSTWADASDKIDVHAPVNAVGRWRPFLNQGQAAMLRGDFENALQFIGRAEALGENLGESASLRREINQRQQGAKYTELLDNFAKAEAKGANKATLYYQRAESEYAMGRYADAFESFSKSLTFPQTPEAEELGRLRQAEAAVASEKYDEAIASYRMLIDKNPGKQRYHVGLSMAHIGKKDYQIALGILNSIIARQPTSQAHYARALVHLSLGDRLNSQRDLDAALYTEPDNPIYLRLQQKLNTPVEKAAEKLAPSP